MTKVMPKPIRHDIPDENNITYFQYGRAEANTDLTLPNHLSGRELEDWLAGYNSANGRPYINEDIH